MITLQLLLELPAGAVMSLSNRPLRIGFIVVITEDLGTIADVSPSPAERF